MRSVKFLIAAGAASLLSSAAFAADMPIMPPPYVPPPVADFGGWYLRGDIGMTNQSLKDLTLATAPFPAGFQNTGFGFDSSTSYDLGVGYRFNNWFRADLTGEFRGRANFHGSQFSPAGVIAPGFAETDNYSGSKSEWVAMANGYVDLGTWWCVTPFVGAGIGMSRNTISGFRDDGVIINGGPPTACLDLRRRRFEVEFCLGAACRSRLRGHARVHGRTGLSLHQPRRWRHRPDQFLRWRHRRQRQRLRDEGHHLAGREARRPLGTDEPAGLRAAAAGHQRLIGPLVSLNLLLTARDLPAPFYLRHVKGVDGRRAMTMWIGPASGVGITS